MKTLWYLRFWRFDSGIIGGFIAGALIALAVGLIGRIFL